MVSTDRLAPLRSPSALLRALGLPAPADPTTAAPAARPIIDGGDAFARGGAADAGLFAPAPSTAVDPALRRELDARMTDERTRPVVPEGLTIGDRGRSVRRLERELKRAGFNPGKVDGRFDASTARAVGRFQSAVGAQSTGVADEKTRSRLHAVDRRIQKSDGDLMGPGQKNARILQAEKRLARLGYDPGAVDGVYDRQTGDAMRKFRADQGKKAGSLLMGTPTERALAAESRALSHDPERRRTRPSAESRRLDRRTAHGAERENADGTRGIGLGAKGDVVKHIQRHLRAAGYDPKHIDGKFDERTAGVLEQFQRRSGLRPTGRVDEATWNKLQRATMEASGPTSPTQREGERSRAVLATERRLKKLGYNPGKVDGLYTEATQRAVDRFRKKKNLGSIGGGVSARVDAALKKAIKQQGATRATFDRITNRGAMNQGVDGTLKINGHEYSFKSGFWGRGSLPPGKYKVGPLIETSESGMVRDGVGFKVVLSNKYDPRVGDVRTGLLIHPDGNVPGTLGCIGLQGGRAQLLRFKRDIQAELRRNGGSFTMKVG